MTTLICCLKTTSKITLGWRLEMGSYSEHRTLPVTGWAIKLKAKETAEPLGRDHFIFKPGQIGLTFV